jgi:hydroxymethylpyrimidine/phosphomethylpyrimidine kinase
MRPLVVSIHAPDTGAGEGFVADAAVAAELSCRTASVATSVLVPEPLPLDVVAKQLTAVHRLGPIGALRVGFVHGAAQVELIAHELRRAAPAAAVVASAARQGTAVLLDAETQVAIVRFLYPAARVVVVRAAELSAFGAREAEDVEGLRAATAELRARGAGAVVVAGLLWRGRVFDLVDDAGKVVLLDTARIHAPHVPGLAGSYAAALTAHLARGLGLPEAADAAQRYVGFRLQRGR